LDSNVLLSDPKAIYAFPGAEVVIPGVVIEEIDEKYSPDTTGYNAREVARILDSFRSHNGLRGQVALENGSILRVELNHRSLDCLRDFFPEVNNDNRLLAVALNLQREAQKKNPPGQVILVSQDAMVRIKADALGLASEDYCCSEARITPTGYQGFVEVEGEAQWVNRLYCEGALSRECLQGISLYPNQYVILKVYGSSQSAIARYDKERDSLLPLRPLFPAYGE